MRIPLISRIMRLRTLPKAPYLAWGEWEQDGGQEQRYFLYGDVIAIFCCDGCRRKVSR